MMASPEVSFVIDPRFNGPRESGYGGYVCGLIASLIGDQV